MHHTSLSRTVRSAAATVSLPEVYEIRYSDCQAILPREEGQNKVASTWGAKLGRKSMGVAGNISVCRNDVQIRGKIKWHTHDDVRVMKTVLPEGP